MTGGKDDYYRPWLNQIDGDGEDAKFDAGAGTPPDPTATTSRPKPAPHSAEMKSAAGANAAATLSNMVAGLKRGWNGFAATTIRWGESADIPARVAKLEIGDKAHQIGGALSREASKAGRTVAGASVAASKASGSAIGKAGAKAGSAIGGAAARTRSATRKGIDSSIAATRTQGGKLATSAKDAARPVIARVAPPKPAAPVVGSAINRLVADEREIAKDAPPTHNRAGDLPLFGDFSETSDPVPDRDIGQAPDTASDGAAPPPAARPRGRRAKSEIEAVNAVPDVNESPAITADSNLDDTDIDDSETGGSGDGGERTKRIGIGLAIVVVLAVAILAGSTFWGRDAGSGGVVASAPGATATTDRSAALAGIGPDRRAEIEAVVEAYIMDHPEIIPQALERLQQREASAAIDRLRPAIERPFAGAWGGNPKGDVVITEYSDFACTFCRRSVPDIERLIKADPGVKIVYRELPILSAQSGPAAKVALAAARKGRYRDFHLALFALGQPSEANILAAAEKAGMTPEDVAAAEADPALDREIASNVSVAQQLRFEGTPSFVVGDTILHGAVGYDALKAAVAEARKGG